MLGDCVSKLKALGVYDKTMLTEMGVDVSKIEPKMKGNVLTSK